MPQDSNESKAHCRKATQEREGAGADGAKYGAGAGPQDRAATTSSTTAPGSGNRGHQKQQSSPALAEVCFQAHDFREREREGGRKRERERERNEQDRTRERKEREREGEEREREGKEREREER